MPKTFGLVKIKRDIKIVDPGDFLELIFPTKPHYAHYASKLLPLIAKGEVDKNSYKYLPQQLGIPNRSTYYYVLQRLMALGLVVRENNVYKLSRRFAKNLERLAEFWEAWIEKMGEGGF